MNDTANSMQDRTWLLDIIMAIRECGGEASLKEIYGHIQRSRTVLPAEWQSVVRASIYRHSSDSPVRTAEDPNVFQRAGRGIWALRHQEDTLTGDSRQAIFALALSKITAEEFAAARDTPQGVEELFRRKVRAIKDRYALC